VLDATVDEEVPWVDETLADEETPLPWLETELEETDNEELLDALAELVPFLM
jgi:hypothetical protein